ncbi:hypothetical protein [Enhygromyxa salina]|uniref:hypothetical protein n=1 Tax=Enhygromyxa salina TaxID=215803 RepID=UPI0011B28928|nr:hypothetical protein [Enhygromyxa salina]
MIVSNSVTLTCEQRLDVGDVDVGEGILRPFERDLTLEVVIPSPVDRRVAAPTDRGRVLEPVRTELLQTPGGLVGLLIHVIVMVTPRTSAG